MQIIKILILLLFLSSCKKEIIEPPETKIERCIVDGQKVGQISQSRAVNDITITIPVVVHVLWNTPAQNISDAQIRSQIDVLNEDFNNENADSVNTPLAFRHLRGKANIRFCLSSYDENGNPTNGIVRKYTTNTSWSPTGAMKLDSLGGSNAWNTISYLNIWVCNLQGALGYATYPGGNPVADGIVVKTSAFGRIGNLFPNYAKGRTATHEVGHYLNIYHIWGDAMCGDDYIYDTPTQEKANYNCPAYPQITCSNSGDMSCNFLDNSYDQCLNMWTIGQCERMRSVIVTQRPGLLKSKGCNRDSISEVGTAAGCVIPYNLHTYDSSKSSFIYWIGNGVSYELRFKKTTDTVWEYRYNIIYSALYPFRLSPLLPNTNYEVQVKSLCRRSRQSTYCNSFYFKTKI